MNYKKILYLLFPFLFSIFSAGVYLFIYRPKFHSPDMTSTFMVFFAALGWSGVIFLGERKLLSISYFYSLFSIVTPFILFELLKILPYDLLWHRIILAIIFIANLWLVDIYKGKLSTDNRYGNGYPR